MPLPTPKKGEKQNEFVSRCVSFVKGENPKTPNDQAVAMCFTKWRDTKGIKRKANINLKYQIPIREQGLINGDFIIQGTAISAVTTTNRHKFLAEELRTSANTLKGVPLLVDHRNEVDAIKGRVISGEFDEVEEKVDFRAKVLDEDIKPMIKDGRLDSVSVGAVVEDIEETDDGFFIPRGIEFKELSLVAVPADGAATFQVALKEAYETVKEKEESYSNNCKEVKMSEQDKVDTEDKPAEPEEKKEETKEEPEAEPEKKEEPEEEKKEEPVTEEKVKGWVKDAIKESDADEEPKKKEPKAEEPEKEEAEEEEAEEEKTEEKYKIVETHGSIKGGAFTLVR